MTQNKPTTTPWGDPDDVHQVRDGIAFFSTPSHGGFHVRPDLNQQIPGYMRREDGWYEEDCDWAIVATVFPDIFPIGDPRLGNAEESLRTWHPEAWELWHKKTLQPGESHARDRDTFDALHEADQVVTAAWGGPMENLAAGMVLVCAVTGGRRRDGSIGSDARETWHVVRAEDYRARGPHGFVIPAGTPETKTRPYRS